MTLMSCKRAEKLMPLYAAGDLPAGLRGRAVAAHVARCAACATLAAEFRASREWVRAADAVPEFGEEFYERLRAGVLDRVNRDARPAAPSRLVPSFAATFAGRRLAYVASFALAACALALAFYFFGDGSRPRRNDIALTPPTGEPAVPPRQTHITPTPDAKTDDQQPPQAAPRDAEQQSRPTGDRGGGTFKRTPTLRHAAPTNNAAAPSPVLTASNDTTRQEVAPRAETVSASRIEIQTADPNIRIIWLTPGSGEEAEPDGVDPDR